MKNTRFCAAAFLALVANAAFAADFDGSKALICATIAANDCVRGETCDAGLPEDYGAPAFMRLDFAKKSVLGPKHASPILLQEKSEQQLLLQGREGTFAWTIAIEAANGNMTVALVSRSNAYVLFGNCTPL
jgi:hypothetical protein